MLIQTGHALIHKCLSGEVLIGAQGETVIRCNCFCNVATDTDLCSADFLNVLREIEKGIKTKQTFATNLTVHIFSHMLHIC